MAPVDSQADEPVQESATEAASDTASEQQQEQVAEGQAEDAAAEAQAEGNALEKAAAEQPKPAKNPVKPFQARIDELTREKYEERRKREALEAEIEALRAAQQRGQEGEQPAKRTDDVVPASVVPELVQREAEKIAAQRQFDNDCNLAFMKGKAAHEDFEDALSTFGSLGGLQRDVVEDALATDAAHDVLYALGKDPDEAARILKLPRAKRIAEFTKMTLKAAPAAKPVSRAAAPIKPVGGTAKKDFDYASDDAADDEWFARRDKERREAGRI